jgi:hypothetical protein
MPTVMANLASRTKLLTFFTADSGSVSLLICSSNVSDGGHRTLERN